MATLARGQTFAVTESVTNTKLHNLVDSGSISGILNADCAANMALANSKLANLTDAGKVSGSSFFNLASIPSGAGYFPIEQLNYAMLVSANQSITGVKSFLEVPRLITSLVSLPSHIVNKNYTDSRVVCGSGTVGNGETIPLPTLPAGRVEGDYTWLFMVGLGSGAITGSHPDGVYYTVSANASRVVTATYTAIGAGDPGTVTANYIIVGVLK